jgi:type IV pilus assembly protein PilZ
MNTMTRPGNAPGMLTLNIKDKSALYASYMPFVKNGGLFIPTNKQYRLGDEVFLLLTLMDGAERLPVAGKVVWLTPRGAQGKRQQGIGVAFSSQDGGETQKKIETYLAGAAADRPTHTM